MGRKILVVDDDENIVRLLRLYLADAGYEVTAAADGSEALDRFHEAQPDLVLLDVMMPVINGWEVLRMLRAESRVPVILLTSRDMVEDKVRGFGLGADDYVVKPFEPQEVMVRIQARIRDMGEMQPAGTAERREGEPNDAAGSAHAGSTDNSGRAAGSTRGIAECGNLRVDLNRYEVWKNGERMALKPKEIQLLYFLLQNRNIVFSRDQLLEKVWDYDYLIDTRTVDAHVKRLRHVLEPSGSIWSIRTVWGVGYKLETRG